MDNHLFRVEETTRVGWKILMEIIETYSYPSIDSTLWTIFEDGPHAVSLVVRMYVYLFEAGWMGGIQSLSLALEMDEILGTPGLLCGSTVGHQTLVRSSLWGRGELRIVILVTTDWTYTITPVGFMTRVFLMRILNLMME